MQKKKIRVKKQKYKQLNFEHEHKNYLAKQLNLSQILVIDAQ
jgi:hypothetical protein